MFKKTLTAIMVFSMIATIFTGCQKSFLIDEEVKKPETTTTQETVTEYDTKEFSEDAFWTLRQFSPDAYTVDNPSRYGPDGEFYRIKAPVDIPYESEELDTWIKESGGTYYLYTQNPGMLNYFFVEGIEPEWINRWFLSEENEYIRIFPNGVPIENYPEVIARNDRGAVMRLYDYLHVVYKDDIYALNKMSEKYGVKVMNCVNFWNAQDSNDEENTKYPNMEKWRNIKKHISENPEAYNWDNYYTPHLYSYTPGHIQTYKPIVEEEWPKIQEMTERYIRAKFVGDTELYKEDFTEDFLATPNFNPEIVKKYYNEKGLVATDIKDFHILATNFDQIVIPTIVEYTICTDKGEYTTREYIYIRRFYNEEEDNFYYQIAYSMNSEAWIEVICYEKYGNDRWTAESNFLAHVG